VAEIKPVNSIALRSASKNAGEKIKVTSIMLLKTNVEKMTD
jgi:hypothetical protein